MHKENNKLGRASYKLNMMPKELQASIEGRRHKKSQTRSLGSGQYERFIALLTFLGHSADLFPLHEVLHTSTRTKVCLGYTQVRFSFVSAWFKARWGRLGKATRDYLLGRLWEC